MKKLLIIATLASLSLFSQAQTQTPPGLQAYFSAIIVSSLDSSIQWYSNILGLKVLNKTVSEERGFKHANLGGEGILLELLELDKALPRKDILKGYADRTYMTGLFKTGFAVTDFEKWMKHLTDNKVSFVGKVVTDQNLGKKMIIVKDPDDNLVQFFEK